MDAAKVSVIHHGAFEHLTRLSRPRSRRSCAAPARPVLLFFGLLRPYKGLEVLLEAWRELSDGAELWVVGRPQDGVDASRRAPAGCVFVRFVSDARAGGVLPPRRRGRAAVHARPSGSTSQGVLATALAFGKPAVLSDVGGFAEVAAIGAARLVPPRDPGALARGARELLGDPGCPAERLAEGARLAARGPYSWREAAARTLALYRQVAR